MTKKKKTSPSSEGLTPEMLVAMDTAALEIVEKTLTNFTLLQKTIFKNSILYLYKENASSHGVQIFLKDDGSGEVGECEITEE